MSRIKEAFKNHKAFIPFITGGDPDLATSEQLLYACAEAGADLIEIGIPFSDPVAEGPVIQAANERALAKGCTTDHLFDMVKRVRKTVTVPIVFLTYMNPVYTYGVEKFMKKCKECGVDGIIIPDIPYEEKMEVAGPMKEYGIELISLVAPTSRERVSMIVKEAQGFIYCVSSLGVTGIRNDLNAQISDTINEIRKITDTPCCIGFGISTPEQAKEMAKISDGAIVGSAIVKLVEEYGTDSVDKVKEYVSKMKQAVLEV